MRILFLSQLLPWPLDAGPKIRSYFVLRHLASAGHAVTMLCFVRPGDRPEDVAALGRYCRSVETVPLRRSRLRDARDALASLVSPTPFLIRRDRSAQMTDRIARLSAGLSFDAVHADQLWMAPYAAACETIPLKVLDQHNAVFRVPQRLAAGQANPVTRRLLRGEARKLERFEQTAIDGFDRVVWVSRADRDAFRPSQRHGTCAQPVIPIAVDPASRPPVARHNPFRVTFIGGLHWPPNAEGVEWFVRHCWPAVSQAVPRAVLTVVGQGAPRSLGRLAEHPRVEVTGYVPDLAHVMAETAVCVVPLKTGAGMRVKILESWCWGVPVVSTTIGAEGLDATPGEQLLTADDPEAFADATIRVLTDARLAAALVDAGRSFVERAYDWRHVYRAWDQVYAS